MTDNPIITYCLFCGSDSIVGAHFSSGLTNKKQLKPKVGIKGISASVGSFTRGSETSVGYPTMHCNLCLKENVFNTNADTTPMRFGIGDGINLAIIPFSLFSVLNEHNYARGDIHKLLDSHLGDFEIFKEHYQKKGINKCKGGRVGYKLKLNLNAEIICWVIISPGGNGLIYHLSYGGGTIKCP